MVHGHDDPEQELEALSQTHPWMLMHAMSENWAKQLSARPVHEPPAVQPWTDEHGVASAHAVGTPVHVEPPPLVAPFVVHPFTGSHCSQ
jgi:hypothetical protein